MNAHISNTPVFILAGGLGTRLSEETGTKPKPMVEVGEIPILIHIMRSYYRHGFNDFVICAGYRSWEIKKFFLNYEFRMNHLGIDHRTDLTQSPTALGRSSAQEKWRVRVVDTGVDCMTGGRLARAFDAIARDQAFTDFALTYGDGLSDVDLAKEFDFHHTHQKMGTVLGVNMQARFGILDVVDDMQVAGFLEKPDDRQDVISGGFFFFKRDFRRFLSNDIECVLERQPLEMLAAHGELMSFRHTGFWHPMDTLRDKTYLEKLWASGSAPWLISSTESTLTSPHYSRGASRLPDVPIENRRELI